ncbi:MAG: hypothetical protein EZS28_049353, partial [Streblomastix strix]
RNKEQGELTDQEQNSFVNWSENNKNIGDDEDDDEEDQLQIQGQATDEMLEIIAPMNPVLWQKLLPHMNIDWDHIKHYGKDKSKSQIQLQKKEEQPMGTLKTKKRKVIQLQDVSLSVQNVLMSILRWLRDFISKEPKMA